MTFVTTFTQSMRQQARTIRYLKFGVFRSENLKPKPMLYIFLSGFMIALYMIQQFVDSMIQECDYVADGFLLLILAFLWLTKPSY